MQIILLEKVGKLGNLGDVVNVKPGYARNFLIPGKLARRAITLGRRDEAGGRVEVLDGLPATAQVLAAKFDNLREGGPASVVAARVPAVASAAASGGTALR